MTPLEMAVACVQALGTPGVTGVIFTAPNGLRLPGFPRGECLNAVERAGVVEHTCIYNAERVLNWLVDRKLVTVAIVGDKIEIKDLSGDGAPGLKQEGDGA